MVSGAKHIVGEVLGRVEDLGRRRGLCLVVNTGFRFHQEKLLQELKDYKFVFPQLVSGRGKRSVAVLPQRNYSNKLSISVELEGKNCTLDLRSNTFLLPRGFQVSHYDSNGTLVTETDSGMYRCYYVGSMRRFPGSQVSASTCSGLSAVIAFSNRTYVIEPVVGDVVGRHLLYRAEDLLPVPSSCGVRAPSPELTLTDHLQHSQRMERDVLAEMRYIELVLVADRNLYQNLGRNRGAVVRRMIDIANTIDLYYRPFNIRIALIGVEVWTTNQIPIDKQAPLTMMQFLKWRENTLLSRLQNDNAHLLIGGYFEYSVTGLAPLSMMCSSDYSGGVNIDNRSSHLPVSSTLAHEIGHNLGMIHDSPARKCTCQGKIMGGCIMDESLGSVLPTAFSSCSQQDLVSSISRGVGICLYNVPSLSQLVAAYECGNLLLEKGEDCDCGKPEGRSGSDLEGFGGKVPEQSGGKVPERSGGKVPVQSGGKVPEQSGGKVREQSGGKVPVQSGGKVPEQSGGKIPERPGGKVPEWPGRKVPERPGGEVLACTGGKVPDRSGVKVLEQTGGEVLEWSGGEVLKQTGDKVSVRTGGARSAEDVCYEITNRRGNENGNCGKDNHNNFIKCLPQNVLCGKIQCTGGNKQPIQSGQMTAFYSSVVIKGVTYNCRGIVSDRGNASTPDLIQHGTKCGSNKLCHNAQCQDVTVLKVKECDDTCNKKGVCNNKGNCHCDVGWSPPFCKTKDSSIDSGPMTRKDTVPGGKPKPAALSVAIMAPVLMVLVLAYFLGKMFMRKAKITSSRSLKQV
ncbi:disintegrin and metalloproteinase domain-containing protein 12-like [Rhincodon typus]|uniref:disintegrin and metalloproteinase domain-containing protein 12-like n=1 Tax=Rhincodon typus TaxID=259920 RepID=UPI0020309275|nr:disintegrin and metalloproteinase domain-containing protein 12-like [Rhincodon typus]